MTVAASLPSKNFCHLLYLLTLVAGERDFADCAWLVAVGVEFSPGWWVVGALPAEATYSVLTLLLFMR